MFRRQCPRRWSLTTVKNRITNTYIYINNNCIIRYCVEHEKKQKKINVCKKNYKRLPSRKSFWAPISLLFFLTPRSATNKELFLITCFGVPVLST